MKQSIVFFDIDGTLIDTKTEHFPESAKQAILELKKKGHLAFINTGRTHFNMPEIIKEFSFDGYVSSCGAHIEYKGNTLLESYVPHELCMEIVAKMREMRIPLFYESRWGLSVDLESPWKHPMLDRVLEMPFGNTLQGLLEKLGTEYEFDKFLILPQADSDMEAFEKYIEPYFTYIRREHGSGEIVQKQYSKATAIQFLEKYFAIAHEDTYCIGDSTNDLEMLRYAAHPIAMGECMEEILPYCEYQTTSMYDRGIENALKYYKLI